MSIDIRRRIVMAYMEAIGKGVDSYIIDGEYSHMVKVYIDLAMNYACILGYKSDSVLRDFDSKLNERERMCAK